VKGRLGKTRGKQLSRVEVIQEDEVPWFEFQGRQMARIKVEDPKLMEGPTWMMVTNNHPTEETKIYGGVVQVKVTPVYPMSTVVNVEKRIEDLDEGQYEERRIAHMARVPAGEEDEAYPQEAVEELKSLWPLVQPSQRTRLRQGLQELAAAPGGMQRAKECQLELLEQLDINQEVVQVPAPWWTAEGQQWAKGRADEMDRMARMAQEDRDATVQLEQPVMEDASEHEDVVPQRSPGRTNSISRRLREACGHVIAPFQVRFGGRGKPSQPIENQGLEAAQQVASMTKIDGGASGVTPK
jgi:hypothetical protein